MLQHLGFKACGLFAVIALGGGTASADYALLQDGRALFNVRVVDTASTQTSQLRVIFKPDSFGYDGRTDSLFPLRQSSGMFSLADYVTTTALISGKGAARQVVAERDWFSYVPPPPPTIPVFTPAPPTPVATPAVPTGPPANVADAKLPLVQRLSKQLDMFIDEQNALAEHLQKQVKLGAMDKEAAVEARLKLLQSQSAILEEHYSDQDELVDRAKEALLNQQEVVKERGRFKSEE